MRRGAACSVVAAEYRSKYLLTAHSGEGIILPIDISSHFHFMQKTAIKHLSEYLSTQGLRSTSQRDSILKVFIEAGQHLSADEMYARVRKSYPGIGYATIYRTLKLLAAAGLAEERRFEDGFTRFEYKKPNAHHDHLICTGCGSIIEFENESIEALQQDVADKKGFKVQSHKLELYGLCAACQRRKR